MTGYPQVNFNPYSMYQNWGYGYQYPVFRGVQNVPQPVSVPQPNVNLQTPPDTVSFKTAEHIQPKPKKEGLSTRAKWAIGIGATTALAVGADFLFCKGKHVKSLWGKVKGNNSKPDGTPPSPPTSNPSAPPKKPNFFEQKGLKVNKEIVSNADGTLYTGTLEKVNKNGEKFVLEYKDGVLQSSKKYTNTGDYVSCKKYTREIDTGYDSNRVPYPINKRYMFEYDKDGKIVNGTLVCERKNCTFYVNNKYSVSKRDKEIIKTRLARKNGTKYVLFENPVERELDAKTKLGWGPLQAIESPFKTHYPLPK